MCIIVLYNCTWCGGDQRTVCATRESTLSPRCCINQPHLTIAWSSRSPTTNTNIRRRRRKHKEKPKTMLLCLWLCEKSLCSFSHHRNRISKNALKICKETWQIQTTDIMIFIFQIYNVCIIPPFKRSCLKVWSVITKPHRGLAGPGSHSLPTKGVDWYI